MNIDSVQIDGYGCLEGLRTGKDPLPPLVIVYGHNEAGKSTFFSCLTSLLYGFRPATNDKHPYAPWSGREIDARAQVSLKDGSVMTVHRRLASIPKGNLTTASGSEDLRNNHLPLAIMEDVPRNIFGQLYALTLDELVSFKGDGWAIVQDRLIGTMGLTDLRSARELAKEYKSEANRLWRPDRRGKPLAMKLKERLDTARQRREEALERDSQLRKHLKERDNAQKELDRLRAERERERSGRAQLEYQLNRLRPVRQSLRRIDKLRQRGGEKQTLVGLPANPTAELVERRRRQEAAAQTAAELAQEVEAVQQRIVAYSDSQRALAEAQEQVEEVKRLTATIKSHEAELERAEERRRQVERRCESQGKRIFSVPWQEVERSQVSGLSLDEISESVQTLQSAREAHRVAKESTDATDVARLPFPGRGRLLVGLIALGLAGGAAAAAIYFPQLLSGFNAMIAGILGVGAVAVIGLVLVVLWIDARRRSRRHNQAIDVTQRNAKTRVAQLEKEERAAFQAVHVAVGELPVQPKWIEDGGHGLRPAMEQMRNLLEELTAHDSAVEERRSNLQETRTSYDSARQQLAFTISDVPANDEDLYRSLDAALEARREAKSAQRELTRLDSRREAATKEEEVATNHLATLEEKLRPLCDDDLDAGAEEAARRTEAHSLADQLAAELALNPDLPRIRREIEELDSREEDWDALDSALEAAYNRQSDLVERTEQLQERIGSLTVEAEHLGRGDTVDQIDGGIELLQEEIRQNKRKRDRTFLLGTLLAEADRRFREEHEPDLLFRAGHHLSQITGGRYNRIDAEKDRQGDSDSTFFVAGPRSRKRRKVRSLSQGTKEQLYLALRLAIVDQLDEGEESLPLFMDELLVNWDSGRLDNAFDLLEMLSRRRQVFLFTCHYAIAAQMEDRGGKIIQLSDPYSDPE